ncbi:MAG: class A beta-lactamase-related serine hydrolase [Gemmatimonadota bacterium]|nr:class A beta-lactamase-related serine hydrolase [Gemmatimonadota bacterium]MDE3013425.1 class A beta-lactamase-related serine hydrolase [Gemmatimonadota bacterium]
MRRKLTPCRFVLVLAVAVSACSADSGAEAASALNELPADLEGRVEARLNSLDAITSIYAKHMPSGREIAIRADRPMNTLSVIKIPVMVQAFRDASSGRLDLRSRYTVEPGDMRRGSGLIQTFEPGLNPTLRGLVMQMIVTSDNTATDMVIDAVGMDRVNDFLASEGYAETRLKATTGDLFRHVWVLADPENASMTDREVFERGFPGDPEASARSFAFEGDSTAWLGRTTAREMGQLLEQILENELTDESATQEMIDMLSRQLYSSRLPQRVRFQGVNVAHKTGDWPPIAGNDVGILFYEGGPTIISVFTNQNTGDFFELEATLGLIAEEIVTAWR